MERDEFYGVTLSDKEPLAQFEMDESGLHCLDEQKLVIKQICLGAEAKEGEFNVVQVESKIKDKETLKIPIAVLKAGETRVLRPNIEFPYASVTFKLIQGTGPVHMTGQNMINEASEVDWYDRENEEVDDEDDEDDDIPPPQRNGKNSNKKK